MASLLPEPIRSPEDRRLVPAEIRQRILDLKAEHPAFRPHEIASVLRRRDDCRIHHNTVQRILANNALPAGVRGQFPLYVYMQDGVERRKSIISLYFDSPNMRSIADYLETTRIRVYETLYRFMREDFAGLPDKSHVPEQPARTVDLAAIAALRRLQANPELGAFRIHAALVAIGIQLSPRTCGRIGPEPSGLCAGCATCASSGRHERGASRSA